jgi:hypothetical protein
MFLVRPWPRAANVTNSKADFLAPVNNPGEFNVEVE